MSSVATTNRASEMWNNIEVNNQSAAKHYGYKQYPTMPNYYNYQNHFFSPNSEYSNGTSAGYTEKTHGHNQIDAAVKLEPGNWQGFPSNYMASHANADAINKWREMNFYTQHYENYGYDQRMNPMNQHCPEMTEEARSINSPGQCSIPETSYGSPQSATSIAKSPDVDDSPNLRALLSKPHKKRTSPYFVKTDKSYAQDMHMILNQEEINEWEKTNETTEKKRNLSQFHGGFQSKVQTSVKKVVGGAVAIEDAPSSQEPTESCHDMTRVEAGGDNADYAENKMAAATEAQTFFPWMKSVNGKMFILIIQN